MSALAKNSKPLTRTQSHNTTDPFRALDQQFQIGISAFTMGLSPASMGLAYADWLMHLALSPGTVTRLYIDAWQRSFDTTWLTSWTHGRENSDDSNTHADRRFKSEEWEHFPFNVYRDCFLSLQDWWKAATSNLNGINQRHVNVVNFFNRQLLDALSPSNYIWANPTALKKMGQTFGQSLVNGYWHYLDDCRHLLAGDLPHHLQPYQVGIDLATTPGQVVYQNELIELIQYAPQTPSVYAEPILIVPAWIMKYYILDLTPEQSMVEYLVQQGHTVFLISWKNPTEKDRNIGFNDYMKLSFLESLDVINNIVPNQKIHAAGYCIGGILLSIGAAWLSRQKDDRLKSVTLLAAQTDFDNPGEMSMFMDESQLAFLGNIMRQQGYLGKLQMKGMFQLMRANDLIWSYWINHYLLGERTQVTELMAWSADSTRMPYKMHSEYLESLYLRDELAEGRYQVDGQEMVLNSIKLPIFCVATEEDHLSPWRSVYKLHLLTATDLTFVLTNGGHNAGIVSTLDNPRRYYRVGNTKSEAEYQSPDTWLADHPKVNAGSWWPCWHQWLADHSGTKLASSSAIGNKDYPALCAAPGTYVFQQ